MHRRAPITARTHVSMIYAGSCIVKETYVLPERHARVRIDFTKGVQIDATLPDRTWRKVASRNDQSIREERKKASKRERERDSWNYWPVRALSLCENSHFRRLLLAVYPHSAVGPRGTRCRNPEKETAG